VLQSAVIDFQSECVLDRLIGITLDNGFLGYFSPAVLPQEFTHFSFPCRACSRLTMIVASRACLLALPRPELFQQSHPAASHHPPGADGREY
jgi:hypothetical protein